jgi:hypothetical protein
MRVPLRVVPMLLFLLGGCSTHVLEEVREISPPRDCAETTKLFNTFSMRATRTSWKGTKSDPSATLTLELAFNNDKKWPIALSNSGAGVLYAVEFSLQGANGTSHKPKEAAGVALIAEAKTLKKPEPRPFFSQTPRTDSNTKVDTTIRNVNFRIRPNESETGKLVFEVPRDNYLLAIERKFAGKPVGGEPSEHIAVCKISTAAAVRPARLPAYA